MKKEVLLWYKEFMISSFFLVWKFILCEMPVSHAVLFSFSAAQLLRYYRSVIATLFDISKYAKIFAYLKIFCMLEKYNLKK